MSTKTKANKKWKSIILLEINWKLVLIQKDKKLRHWMKGFRRDLLLKGKGMSFCQILGTSKLRGQFLKIKIHKNKWCQTSWPLKMIQPKNMKQYKKACLKIRVIQHQKPHFKNCKKGKLLNMVFSHHQRIEIIKNKAKRQKRKKKIWFPIWIKRWKLAKTTKCTLINQLQLKIRLQLNKKLKAKR